MSDHTGKKVRQFRENFGMTTAQATVLVGGIGRGTWTYWENNTCPAERLQDIAKLTADPAATFDWLTHPTSMMPVLELIKPIPEVTEAHLKTKQKPAKKKKKSKSKISRRIFSPQDKANIIAYVDKARDTKGLSIVDALNSIGVWQGAYNKWKKTRLPRPNGAAVPGVIDKSPLPDSTPTEHNATNHTNLPQQRVPKKSGMPATADKLTPMAVLMMRYQCPRCGQNLVIEEE